MELNEFFLSDSRNAWVSLNKVLGELGRIIFIRLQIGFLRGIRRVRSQTLQQYLVINWNSNLQLKNEGRKFRYTAG